MPSGGYVGQVEGNYEWREYDRKWFEWEKEGSILSRTPTPLVSKKSPDMKVLPQLAGD